MKYLLVFTFLITGIMNAQKTLQLGQNESSPKANLNQVAWIAGHWTGEAFGGMAEEIWSPPLGDSMMFVFKQVNEDKVTFYEIGHIRQIDESLILQLKHFHGDLKGWEEKDETVDFKLVKIEEDKAFFEGFTIEKVNENQLNLYVLIEQDEKTEEVLFQYKRVKR